MKKIINRLICLCRGHKWKGTYITIWLDPFDLSDAIQSRLPYYKCTRCGKTKEEVI